jgi:hypothetical protein
MSVWARYREWLLRVVWCVTCGRPFLLEQRLTPLEEDLHDAQGIEAAESPWRCWRCR